MYRIVQRLGYDHQAVIPVLENLTLEEARERASNISNLSPSGSISMILDWKDDPVAYYFQGVEQPALFGDEE